LEGLTLSVALKHELALADCVCVTVLWALGLDRSLDTVADPDGDLHGKALEASRRPTRAGKARKANSDYDF
jgi:hypothetical protein